MKDLASLSVRRPVLAAVGAIVVVVLGLLSILELGVRELPATASPEVTVTAMYPGADAEVIENQITEPLEAEITTIQGIRSLESVSREDRSTVVVEFERGTVDLDEAANDVRDRVARATGDLPVDAEPPVVSLDDAEGRPVYYIRVASDQRDPMELTELAENRIQDQMETIPGVSGVNIWGSKTFSMRLWLDPTKMSAYGLVAQDIRAAVQAQNVELPSGRIDGDEVELTVRASSRLRTEQDFEEVVLLRQDNEIVRLADVAQIELSPTDERGGLRTNGEQTVMVVVTPRSDANQIDVVDEAKIRLANIQANLPDDVRAEAVFDGTTHVRNSVREVAQTIFIALLIVIGVIFFFLGEFRTTVIPLLVIPVAIIGSFMVMVVAGLSINVLTLLALVLALGLVVDDSIVVLENVYSKIEEGMSPRDAAITGTREVFFAVVATTLSLIAVFFPILVMDGVTGDLFWEFGLVMAGTILLSSLSALTLVPALSAKLLKKRDKLPWFRRVTQPFFDGLATLYKGELDAYMKVRWITFGIIAAALAGAYGLYQTLPDELAPDEDRGEFRIFADGPQGTNAEYMDRYMVDTMEYIKEEVPERELMMTVSSPSFGADQTVNSGFHFVVLNDADERERSQDEIAGMLQGGLGAFPMGDAFVSQPATIADDFGGLPVQFVLQNLETEALRDGLPAFQRAAFQREEFAFVQSDLEFNQPDLMVEVDRERAAAFGVSVEEVNQVLEMNLSSLPMGTFLRQSTQYDIIAKVPRGARNEPADLSELSVRNDDGELVSLEDVVRMREQAGTPVRYRFDRFNSATVSAQLAPGYTMGDGVEAMREVAQEVLDDSFSTTLTGQSREYDESSADLLFAFILAIFLVYLVLSAQFESFRDSLTILLTVPLALVGSLLALWYFGHTLNIFSQIGMILLIGLISKNGILIVEFANQLRARGMGVEEAAREAAARRFRPVLMTSLSTILGILPLALAVGAGAESRVPMGIAFIGGMVVGTFFTLFVVPALYTYITRATMSRSQREAALIQQSDEE